MKKIVLLTTSIILLLVVSIFIASITGIIGVTLPKLTGPYKVGRVNYDLVDSSRNEIFASSPNKKREIVITVYYPAQVPSTTKPAPYVEGKMAEILAAKVHMPAFIVNLIHSHAYEHVPVVQGTFPVVLFSPGIGTPPIEYTSAVEDLASHGYIVAVIYHTYSVPVTVFSNGNVALISDAGIKSENEPDGTSDAQTNKDRNLIGSVWAADARFVLDQLSQMNTHDTLLEDHLNLKDVGMYGHSFGGATSAQVLSGDKRFKAGINMDGTAFAMTDPTKIKQPFLWMSSDYSQVTDSQLKQINMTRKEFLNKTGEKNKERDEFINKLPVGSLFILKGSTHSSYITDEALIGQIIPGMQDPLATIDSVAAITTINTQVSTFFNKYLKQ